MGAAMSEHDKVTMLGLTYDDVLLLPDASDEVQESQTHQSPKTY